MNARVLFLPILCLLGLQGLSQVIYGSSLPLPVKKSCDSVVISEIGKAAFDANVHYIKCDNQSGTFTGGEKWNNYTVFYSFNFPNVKESHVIFSLVHRSTDKKIGVVKDVAFKNYTRLPESIKKKGVKIISYEEAKKIAIGADEMLKKNATRLYAEISTEYDAAKKDYNFVWYFYHMEPVKNSEAESYTTYSVLINGETGKIISTNKG